MNKKVFLGGAVTVLAGLGIYKYVNKKNNDSPENWTTADIPDLTDKVAIITGANSGIGYETAKEFARMGAQTIIACRSINKARAALAQLQTEIPNAPVEIMQLDLASLASVREFVETFKEKYQRLDLLVNNAGIMNVPYAKTVDGFESQLGTNHMGHFALTGLLLDIILATPGARVVNISSVGHRGGKMDFDNLMFYDGQGYEGQAAYRRSKLANLLFTYELERRFEEYGVDAIAVAAHPGISNTDLADHMPVIKILRPILGWYLQSAAMGALPTIRAAVDPDVTGGQYFGPGGKDEHAGYPVVVSSSDASHNNADAEQLWRVSEALTGVQYNWNNQ